MVFPQTLPDGRPRRAVLDQAETDGLWKGELRVTTVDGRQMPVRVSVFPIRQPGDKQFEYFSFL